MDAALIRAIAPRIEAAGFHALWLNDTPAGDALTGLAAAAAVTSTLVLATGVLAFDRRPADKIAASVARLGLPRDRLVLGVGSGSARKPLDLVTAQLAELRALIDVPIVLGALGPKMRALGARTADGVLLSWLTPAAAAAAVDDAHRESDAVAQSRPRVAIYARTAVDPAAQGRLDAESAAYGSYPNYAANFARLGIAASDTTIGPSDVGIRVDAYLESVDELVLRAITPSGTVDDLLRFVENPDLTQRLG